MYLVSQVGIRRDVITRDICRYLGRDAVVHPGTFLFYDHETDQHKEAYRIDASQKLTPDIIQKLKNNSTRLEQEGWANSSGDSESHRSRGAYSPPSYPGRDAPGYSGSYESAYNHEEYAIQSLAGYSNISNSSQSQSQYPQSQTDYGVARKSRPVHSRSKAPSHSSSHGSSYHQQEYAVQLLAGYSDIPTFSQDQHQYSQSQTDYGVVPKSRLLHSRRNAPGFSGSHGSGYNIALHSSQGQSLDSQDDPLQDMPLATMADGDHKRWQHNQDRMRDLPNIPD
ncbi:hypothetical protein M406DRAFT_74909 [Cryphonectria parasitica EP155]|uniref:Uncharacterized protein n=1 Tax=Cryphonectria parasitica (strain ATCC 38755 / EP155) TaxID=660469 RepID=A0A9P5CLG3_CRYP1|nr:uncharacterized protein M406DRAFT_74909 [Cryphonectria parasitica EP155]KAF3761991.1 hypothetical protein M406DRAFT_74909 [Cryphonectria parasitica EP155]